MNENRLTYQPYRSQSIFIPILWVSNGFCIFILGYAAAEKAWSVLALMTGLTLVSVWLICMLQKQAHTLVLADESGITLIHDRKTAYRHIPWDALSYGYQAPNLRNFQYLILSNEHLTDKQAKALANKCSMHSQIYLDGCVGIPLDTMQDTAPLVDRIAQHIPCPGNHPGV